MRLTALLCLMAFLVRPCAAQTGRGLDFAALNLHRIHTNERGMQVLGSWGAINMVSGIAGYIASGNRESQSFHGMNAIWGAVNLGIAGAGYLGARKETRAKYTCGEALHRYEATRRLYLINAGLDVLYISSGVYLKEHARNVPDHPEVWRGYGSSLILQGAGLLLFDVAMSAAHQKRDKAWYRLLQGVCVTGNGVGLRYNF